MKTYFLYPIFCALMLAAAPVGAQTVLSIDFNERVVDQSTNTANNAAGFDSFLINSNTSITAVQSGNSTRVFGALTVTLAGIGTTVTYDDRLRAAPVNAGAFTLGAIYRDVVFNGSANNGDGLSVTVDGLIAGQFYKVTIYSYDVSSTGIRVSDWTANGATVKSAYTFNGSTAPTSDTDNQFNFKIPADGTGRILIAGRRNAATSSAGSVFINAMKMELTTADVVPAASTVYVGDNAPAFTVQAAGAAYQWRKDTTDILNATNVSLIISNAQVGDAADYACVVTYAGGSITSTVAHLTVIPVVDIRSGLISYWPLGSVVTNLPDLTTPDTTPNANHLYLTNMDGSNLSLGQRGLGMSFNGTSTLLARIHTNSVGLPIYSYPAYTIAMWVKGNFTNQADRRVFSESANNNNNPLVNIGTDNAGTNSTVDIFIRNNDGVTPLNHRKSSLPAFDGNWHHIAWVDNNGFPRLYVDGVLDTNDFTYARGTLTPNIMTLGGILRTTPGSFYGGLIDDVMLYRRSLSGAEVQSVMTCGPFVTAPAVTVPIGPQNRTNYLGTTATFAPFYDTCIPAVYQWYFGANRITDQTNATLAITNVALANAGEYWVGVTNASGGTTSSVATLTVINTHPPVARDNGVATTQNTPVGLVFAKLLGNDSDSDGDTLAVIAVSATSTNGGAVTMTSTNVIYTPLAGFLGADLFTYTIGDGHTGTATANVNVMVVSGNLPTQNQVALITSGSSVIVRFAGVPGHGYSVERSTDLINWTSLGTQTAPSHGLIDFTDANPPVGSAFYRTVGQ